MSFAKFLTSVLFTLQVLVLSAQIPQGYYQGTENKTGAELKIALYNIIKDHTVISYSGLWDAFYYTDKKPNGKVWDMYSDIPGGTPPYQYTFFSDQCGNYNSEGDCYNREHSMPKSWFNDASPMYSDLFHLVPTDGYVNNMRGNYPFGRVGNTNWTSMNGSKRGTSNFPGYSGIVFEPIDAYKGDFARMFFYMTTRYHNLVANWNSDMLNNTSFPAFTPWAKELLLLWHHQDPVSQKEIDRNNVIYYSYQNNRNPFIDYPEFADLIWGSGVLPLVFNSSPNTSVLAGQNYTYNITASGGTGNISITCQQKPQWLTFSATGNGTATLSGTPQAPDAGTYTIKLTASDQSGNSVVQQYELTVTLPQVLAFNTQPLLLIQQGNLYSYQAVASVSNNASAIVTLSCELKPQWLNFSITGNGVGLLQGTPDETNLGPHNVILKATYQEQSVFQNFTIVVTESMAGGWKTEPFENMPEASSSYTSFSWSGNYNLTWHATEARTDQSIDDRAICLRHSLGSGIQSQTISGGCDRISFMHQQKFTGSGGTISLYINDQLIGDAVSVGTQVQTAVFENLNIEGDFIIRLVSNGLTRIAIDNLSWYTLQEENLPPSIEQIQFLPTLPSAFESVNVQCQITDPEDDAIYAFVNWGYSEDNLSNAVAMDSQESLFEGSIPPNEPEAIIFFRITAYDSQGNQTASELFSYVVAGVNIPENPNSNCLLTVLPNPASSNQPIKISNTCFAIEKISIWGMQGQLIYKQDIIVPSTHLSIAPVGLKPGMYLIGIEGQKQRKTLRLIVF